MPLPDVVLTPPQGETVSSFLTAVRVVADGGSPIRRLGICYVPGDSAPTLADVVVDVDGPWELDTDYPLQITGLFSNQRYTVAGFAANDDGVQYSAPAGVTTQGVPILTTSAPVLVAGSTYRSGGAFIAGGGLAILEKGLVYAPHRTPTTAGSKVTVAVGDGSPADFVVLLPDLPADRTTHVRAHAINALGTGYGDEHSIDVGDVRRPAGSTRPGLGLDL